MSRFGLVMVILSLFVFLGLCYYPSGVPKSREDCAGGTISAKGGSDTPETRKLNLGPILTVYDRAALRLWSLESSCGKDESWRTTWPERGEFQTTPIWEQDFRDIFGREPRWDDPDAMLREDVPDWLWWRAHQNRLPTPHTVDRLVRLYQEGH